WLAEQAEEELTAIPTRQNAHGIVHAQARVELDVVVHYPEGIGRRESDAHAAEGRLRDPVAALLDELALRQTGRPARQVARIGGKGIDLFRGAGDEDAQMLYVSHGSFLVAGKR